MQKAIVSSFDNPWSDKFGIKFIDKIDKKRYRYSDWCK